MLDCNAGRAVVAKGKKRISKKELVDCFTEIISDHLSTMPIEEQRARLNAAKRRLASGRREKRPTVQAVSETSPIRLSARSPHGEH